MALTDEQRADVKSMLDDLQSTLLGELRKGLKDQAKGFTEDLEDIKVNMKGGADEVASMKTAIEKAMGDLQATVQLMNVTMGNHKVDIDGAVEELKRVEQAAMVAAASGPRSDEIVNALKIQVAKVEEEMRSEKERMKEEQRKGEQTREERTKEGQEGQTRKDEGRAAEEKTTTASASAGLQAGGDQGMARTEASPEDPWHKHASADTPQPQPQRWSAECAHAVPNGHRIRGWPTPHQGCQGVLA